MPQLQIQKKSTMNGSLTGRQLSAAGDKYARNRADQQFCTRLLCGTASTPYEALGDTHTHTQQTMAYQSALLAWMQVVRRKSRSHRSVHGDGDGHDTALLWCSSVVYSGLLGDRCGQLRSVQVRVIPTKRLFISKFIDHYYIYIVTACAAATMKEKVQRVSESSFLFVLLYFFCLLFLLIWCCFSCSC